jgi:hypothetical protein
MTNNNLFNKQELLASIKDYDSFDDFYDSINHESDNFVEVFWEMKDRLFERIKERIDTLLSAEDNGRETYTDEMSGQVKNS